MTLIQSRRLTLAVGLRVVETQNIPPFAQALVSRDLVNGIYPLVLASSLPMTKPSPIFVQTLLQYKQKLTHFG
jgi:hypothetical protein